MRLINVSTRLLQNKYQRQLLFIGQIFNTKEKFGFDDLIMLCLAMGIFSEKRRKENNQIMMNVTNQNEQNRLLTTRTLLYRKST